MQSWHRWRGPLAVALLVTSLLLLAVRTVTLGLAMQSGDGGFLGGIPLGDDLLLVATASAVLWCATPVIVDDRPQPSPHAWPITLTGLVVVGLSVLGWLALAVRDLWMLLSRPGGNSGFLLSAIDGLLRLVLPLLALLAVIAAVRRVAAWRSSAGATRVLPPDDADGATDNSADNSADDSADDSVDESPAPARLPAAWQPDEATGAVWLTADDAAQGRPALSWSDPGTTDSQKDSKQLPRAPAVQSAAEDDDLR